MINPFVSLTVIVKSGDDTLYSEKDYVRSGFKAIASDLGKDDKFVDQLWKYFEEGKPAIDCVLKEWNRMDMKDMLLKVYRSHIPNITLYDGVIEIIQSLRDAGIKVGIITDGRPEGQRNKIQALGLESLIDDIIITDDLGGVQFRKPCDIAFQIIQRRWAIPFSELVYVGDNFLKDFQAPILLGMKAICINNPDGIYLRG